MAKRIIWSFRAQKDRKLILDFWIKKTLSTAYSKKLNGIFIDTIKIIAEFPKIGKESNYKTSLIFLFSLFQETCINPPNHLLLILPVELFGDIQTIGFPLAELLRIGKH